MESLNRENILLKFIDRYMMNELNNSDLISTEKIKFEGTEVTKKFVARHKIVYFINLSFFLMNGENLFEGDFRSFKNGTVYSNLKSLSYKGWNLDKEEMGVINQEEMDIIIKTINYFSNFNLDNLLKMNHSDFAWKFFFKSSQNGNTDKINLEEVVNFYKNSVITKQYLKYIGLDASSSFILRDQYAIS